MSEERRRILDMLAGGKITPDEAERLLDALGQNRPEPSVPAVESAEPIRDRPKYLRVQVSPKNGKGDSVNVRIPLLLIRTGIKLKGLMPEKAKQKVDEALEQKGINFHLDDLSGDQLEEILVAMREARIEVDDEMEQVRVFCE